jgi:hypothetical protein
MGEAVFLDVMLHDCFLHVLFCSPLSLFGAITILVERLCGFNAARILLYITLSLSQSTICLIASAVALGCLLICFFTLELHPYWDFACTCPHSPCAVVH